MGWLSLLRGALTGPPDRLTFAHRFSLSHLAALAYDSLVPMFNEAERSDDLHVDAAQFTATHWSVVLAAGQGESEERTAALESLCRTYWLPLYVYVRRRGHEPADAQDLTQEFFARLLEKDYLHAVDRSKGKFRSFLLAGLDHYLANERRGAKTHKNGGQFTYISLNDASAEAQYAQLSSATLSPEM